MTTGKVHIKCSVTYEDMAVVSFKDLAQAVFGEKFDADAQFQMRPANEGHLMLVQFSRKERDYESPIDASPLKREVSTPEPEYANPPGAWRPL